jgi:nondiscriminating glutamyl-tRNA synthetase
VRIAPSPTGNLHVGTARTALYNYLFARHNKGAFVMRLEDTDEMRSDEAYTKDIIDGLKWLGLNWDEGPDIGGPYPPYRQTEKVDHYEKVAQKLISSGHAYHCYCSPEELAALKEDQKNDNVASRYDNRCRNIAPEKMKQYEAEKRVPAIRFKVEEPRIVSWNDGIKGEISIDTADLGGDMVIVKSNGVAIYNFAVVVDDVDMHITDVIRGEDHIHNTAKQILLYEAMNQPQPVFAHAALIFDTERRKLSKRHHGELVHVDKYREDGYMPEAIVNYLAQMSWMPGEGKEIFTLEEGVQMFALERVSKSPAVFDVPRLNWFNGHYIRTLPIELITQRAMPFMQAYDLKQYPQDKIEQIVATVREGLTTLSEITEAVSYFFEKQIQIPAELMETLLCTDASKKVLKAVLDKLPEFPWGDPKGCKAVIDGIGKELGLKGKDLYWPVRGALCGRTSGPDLGSTLSILGADRVKTRIEGALGLCLQA